MYLYIFYVHVYICPLSVLWAKLSEIKNKIDSDRGN